MTEPHPPLDCDHQPVCWKFRYDDKQQEGMLEFCNRHYCIHDTRSRPAKESSNSKAEPSHARISDDVLRSDKVSTIINQIEQMVFDSDIDDAYSRPIFEKINELRTKEREQG